MTSAGEWRGRTGDSWATEWRRTDRSFSVLTDHLLTRVRSLKPSRVVDIGCGAGELTLAIARNHPDALVTGLDVSPQLLAVARERGANLPNASFALADAARWSRPSERPDLLVSRHGVMFFDEPQAAFAHLRDQAAQGAELVFSCFRARKDNPVFTEIASLLPPTHAADSPLAGYFPGPFAFADEEWVQRLLEGAGWRDVRLVPQDFGMIVGAGPDPIEDALGYFRRIGPAAPVLTEMPAHKRDTVLDRLRSVCRSRLQDGLVVFPAAAWIVQASSH